MHGEDVQRAPQWHGGRGGERRLLVRSPFRTERAKVSPAGRWLLFSSVHTGRLELYVQPYSGSGGAVGVGRLGGRLPRWAPESRTLYFRSGDEIVAAPIRNVGGRLEFGAETRLLEAPLAGSEGPLATADGRRFLVLLREKPPGGPELRIVLGWNREVAARLEASR